MSFRAFVVAAVCLPFSSGTPSIPTAEDLAIYKAKKEVVMAKLDEASTSGPASYHEVGAVPIKHDPFIDFTFAESGSDTAKIAVRGSEGSTTSAHPQTVEHHISDLWVEDNNGKVVFFKDTSGEISTEEKEASIVSEFVVPVDATTLTPYEYCNKHGLWKGPTYNVANELESARLHAFVSADGDTGIDTPTSLRKASSPPVKHDPMLSFAADDKATIAVRGAGGSATSLHPMNNAHHISTMWVTGQHGNILYMVNSTEFEKPTDEFTVPENTTLLRPYEYCNKHGLWIGPKYVYPPPKDASFATCATPQFTALALGFFALYAY